MAHIDSLGVFLAAAGEPDIVEKLKQRMTGTMGVWAEPFVALRLPKLFNLRTDPFERADITSNTYWDWVFHKGYLVLAATAVVVPFMETFKELPPRQKARGSSALKRQ